MHEKNDGKILYRLNTRDDCRFMKLVLDCKIMLLMTKYLSHTQKSSLFTNYNFFRKSSTPSHL